MLRCQYAVAASFSSYFVEFIHETPIHFLAGAVALMALTLINIKGTRESGAFQVAVTTAKILLLGWFVAGGLSSFDTGHLLEKMSTDVTGIGGTAAMVFITFFGFSAIAASAGEIKKPTKKK